MCVFGLGLSGWSAAASIVPPTNRLNASAGFERVGHVGCHAAPHLVGIISSGANMSILTWIIVGLVAGVLASIVMGGTGYGLIGDIIIGIVGAFVGGWIFRALGTGAPFAGLGGVIFVAFIGAVVLLFLLRLLRGATVRRPL
jgi:uncharacterized membrane protein YeaQ/YmgE (transglycosylase-associated protein family)